MDAKIFQVVSQSEPITISAAGKDMAKSTIHLSEPGKWGDAVVATLLGEDAQTQHKPGELVSASIKLSVHEYEGRKYQDVVVRSIVTVAPIFPF